MAPYATTRLSSKGQVVIPEEVRNDLGLTEGDQFVVIGQGDAVILKVITAPKLADFEKLLAQGRVDLGRIPPSPVMEGEVIAKRNGCRERTPEACSKGASQCRRTAGDPQGVGR